MALTPIVHNSNDLHHPHHGHPHHGHPHHGQPHHGHHHGMFEKNSEITKGYLYQLSSGGVLANITQPGNSGLLVGVAVYGTGTLYWTGSGDPPTTATGYGSLQDSLNNTALVTVSVNSNNLLDNVPLASLIPYLNPSINKYYPINRELTGKDNITFQGNANGISEPIALLFFFANFATKPTH